MKVPQACIPRLNRLIREVNTALALPVNTPVCTAAIISITAHQATYTSRIEAVVRVARMPAIIHGMGQAILTNLTQIQTTLDSIVDILHYQVSSLALSRYNTD